MAESGAEQRVKRLRAALESGRWAPVQRMLAALNPAESASLLASLPSRERALIWEMVDPADDGEVLLHLPEDVRAELIEQMDTAELVAAAGDMEIDDLADFLDSLPETVTAQVMRALSDTDRARLEAVMVHDPDTAGGLMNTDTVTVRPDVSLEVVMRYLRKRGELPLHTDALFVVDRYGVYLGTLSLERILTSDPEQLVQKVMDHELEALPVSMPAHEVAQRFQSSDLVSAPVVDDQRHRLIGRITVDDVVDVIRAEAERNLLSMAGLDDQEDLFAPVPRAARRRAIWLGLNLCTAFLAARVVGLFEATLEQIIALAVLMPIVASMGGIAANQIVALMVRGLALGQVGAGNTGALLRKELLVALFNGLLWGAAVAGVVWWWFQWPLLSLVIGLALLLNLLLAASAGLLVPLLLRRMGLDPALAGSMVVTTITDVMGFFLFLGLGTLILL
ncbi:magnesium transporter [Panacagrimonas sp.]|uniref:magnesium transporter n=1 Tax=Panacagrimonas sp. TaxID=2480088 RepID=UPI003B52FEB9